ncbi:hypothetical protein K435DRAFT_782265 [Dendrothele bispora CBS 962.96]|uniref:DUF6699 domain-containing protein n=1 Tax=Dendrothele bispora (strain CBS 962.96) TaxID=1314807 RepID=A0A4V4HDN3_DENBC|nr:hypothetical protein K435DRAFT_782265 [Dendrothele bispora CBS 962.96]
MDMFWNYPEPLPNGGAFAPPPPPPPPPTSPSSRQNPGPFQHYVPPVRPSALRNPIVPPIQTQMHMHTQTQAQAQAQIHPGNFAHTCSPTTCTPYTLHTQTPWVTPQTPHAPALPPVDVNHDHDLNRNSNSNFFANPGPPPQPLQFPPQPQPPLGANPSIPFIPPSQPQPQGVNFTFPNFPAWPPDGPPAPAPQAGPGAGVVPGLGSGLVLIPTPNSAHSQGLGNSYSFHHHYYNYTPSASVAASGVGVGVGVGLGVGGLGVGADNGEDDDIDGGGVVPLIQRPQKQRKSSSSRHSRGGTTKRKMKAIEALGGGDLGLGLGADPSLRIHTTTTTTRGGNNRLVWRPDFGMKPKICDRIGSALRFPCYTTQHPKLVSLLKHKPPPQHALWWDLRSNPLIALTASPSGASGSAGASVLHSQTFLPLTPAELYRPATEPPMRKMRIWHERLPWYIDVRASKGGVGSASFDPFHHSPSSSWEKQHGGRSWYVNNYNGGGDQDGWEEEVGNEEEGGITVLDVMQQIVEFLHHVVQETDFSRGVVGSTVSTTRFGTNFGGGEILNRPERMAIRDAASVRGGLILGGGRLGPGLMGGGGGSRRLAVPTEMARVDFLLHEYMDAKKGRWEMRTGYEHE